MKTPFTIYFGSSSQSRQKLLRHARIPFTLVKQSADESKCDWNLPLSDVVKNIAADVVAFGNPAQECRNLV